VLQYRKERRRSPMNKQKITSRINMPFRDIIWGLYICSVLVFLYYQRVIAIVNIPTMVHYILPFGICMLVAAVAIFLVNKISFKVLSSLLFISIMLITIYWFVILMETPPSSEDITEGTWLDRFWAQPIILSIYFGIIIPFLRSWILHLQPSNPRKMDNSKEIYLNIGIFAILIGALAKFTPTWPILFSFIVSLLLGGFVALKSINQIQDRKLDPVLNVNASHFPSKGKLLMLLGNLISNATLGWVWLAIISYNGFKFENLMPFGLGFLIYYIWKVGCSLFKLKPDLMLEGIAAMLIVILGNFVMWWLHLNWIHLQLVLFPIWLSGFVSAVLLNQTFSILHGDKTSAIKLEEIKQKYNWPILVIVFNFCVLNFMNLIYLVYRVGYYGTVDFIVFRFGIIFAIISASINGLLYLICKRI
jgi:hypothetical protein